MMIEISVVLPTFNPDPDRLRATLESLGAQTLRQDLWECVIVDNASTSPIDSEWCEAKAGRPVKLVREPEPGLSHARLAGILNSTAELVIFSDDDNVLDPRYLENTVRLMNENPRVGVAGGRSLPVYQTKPPDWFVDGMAPLGCRDLGDDPLVASGKDFASNPQYPNCAPIGAGMVFRKEAIQGWVKMVGKSGISDRKGKSLSSAGDCDMVLHALSAGYDAAYWPELKLEHLIPEARLTEQYLAAVSRAAFRDFIRVLALHGIRPWLPVSSASVPLRMVRAWFRNRAWRGPVESIRWNSACGQFEGRARIGREPENTELFRQVSS